MVRATRVAVSLIRPRVTHVDVICRKVGLVRLDLIAAIAGQDMEHAVLDSRQKATHAPAMSSRKKAENECIH